MNSLACEVRGNQFNDHDADYSAVDGQVETLNELERTCANKIRSIWGGAPRISYTGDGSALEYGVGEIPIDAEMPWGGQAKYREEGIEAAFFGIIRGISNVVTGIVQFGAGLLGFYDLSTGEWGWDLNNVGTTLNVVVQAGAALLLTVASLPYALDRLLGGAPQDTWMTNAFEWGWGTMGAMFPSAEDWEEDAWAAGTELTLGLASLAIPAGAAATVGVKLSAGVASKLIAGLQLANKWMNTLDPLSMMTKLGGKGLSEMGSIVDPQIRQLVETINRLFPDGVTAEKLQTVGSRIDAEVSRLIDSGVDAASIFVERGPDGLLRVILPDGVVTIVDSDRAPSAPVFDPDKPPTIPDPDGPGSGADPAYDPSLSSNPKVAGLFDAAGRMLSYEEWAADSRSSYTNPNHAKGEYGELATQAHMESLGYERIDVGRDGSSNVSATGIDGIFRREVDGKTEYVITESKYGTAGLKNTEYSGRQGSVEWILANLEKALGDPDAKSAITNLLVEAEQGGIGLTGTLARVDQFGNVVLTGLTTEGKVARG